MVHGVMFHHFHSSAHSVRPGSLSGEDFGEMLDYLDTRFSIVSPDEFRENLMRETPREEEVVLTFDDALLSQIDVALPLLESRGIQAVFAVYSSVFSGQPDPLEIFAAFRQEGFSSFEAFWNAFLELSSKISPKSVAKLGLLYPPDHLADFPFYSTQERQFRFMRDSVLGPAIYAEVMWGLIDAHDDFNLQAVINQLWMSVADLKALISAGHSIGLHSHSHPTRMDSLSPEEQRAEYQKNYDWIENTLGVRSLFVAHPCGSYSSDTIRILGELGVEVGFRSSLSPGFSNSRLEIPREDHSNIFRMMKSGEA
jgi:peptidoglycan/xylan/chitin deacetylase (PgdA/CDA1 family)